jgi:hypothetical protein
LANGRKALYASIRASNIKYVFQYLKCVKSPQRKLVWLYRVIWVIFDNGVFDYQEKSLGLYLEKFI